MTVRNQLSAFLNTPSLFLDDKISAYKPFHTSKKATAQPPDSENYVFGKRMEEFLEFYFEQSNQYRVLAKSLQINKEKITIGELDFIIEDNTQQKLIHIELVSKFYLYDPAIHEELNRWIGPNKKDSLIQKLDKLQKKQLPLLFNPCTKVELQKFEIEPKTVEQQLCFKAQLYIPYQFETKLIKPIVNIDCIAGFWIRPEQLHRPEFQDAKFNIPIKNDWYCRPNKEAEWEELSSLSTKLDKLHKMKKSPLVWVNKSGSIFEKCFIVWW